MKPLRAFLLVFAVAFSLRAAMIPFVPPQAIVPHAESEIGAIAVSLARTGSFADPYALPTGPTAHVPPVYPALLALIYRTFGLTMTAGYVAWVLGIAAEAAVLAILPWVGTRLGLGGRAGVVGGLAGALLPGWPRPVESLAALAMALLMVAAARRWERDGGSTAGSFAEGAAWGASFHVMPSLLAVFMGTTVFDLVGRRDRRKGVRVAAALLGAALVCVPWGFRNYRVFGEVIFVRSNFGLELRMGNHEGAVTDVDVLGRLEGPRLRHPRANREEARLVQQLGERAYMRQARREALDWIRSHPAAFLRLTAMRAIHFWWGGPPLGWTAAGSALLTLLAILGAWRVLPVLSAPQRAALLIPLATYPLVYYFVVYTPRYAEPVEWILFLLAGGRVSSWLGGTEASEFEPRRR